MSTSRKEAGSEESPAKSYSYYFFMATIAASVILAVIYILFL